MFPNDPRLNPYASPESPRVHGKREHSPPDTDPKYVKIGTYRFACTVCTILGILIGILLAIDFL